MTDFKNEFSWSKSRDEIFKECERKYYYNHYAFWGGWDKDTDSRTREIYILKNLQGIYMWMGERVHGAIEESLKIAREESHLPLKDKIISQMSDEMRRDYSQSQKGLYRRNPKQYHGFFEHEYKKAVDKAKWQQLHNNAVECITNYYTCPILAEAMEVGPGYWMPIENMASFELFKTKIHVKVDFAYRKNGRLIIVDWKTGKPDEKDMTVQLGCYAIYATKKWAVKAKRIDALVYSLLSKEHKEIDMIEGRITEAEHRILTSIDAMKKKLVGERENIPLPEKEFSQAANNKSCNYCNFQKVCQK